MESKVFEVEVEERRGNTLFFIVESKRRVSSWVRLGLASVRLFLKRLNQCVKNKKEDEWEKGWNASVRLFLKRLNQCVKNKKEDKWEKGWNEKGRSWYVKPTRRVASSG